MYRTLILLIIIATVSCEEKKNNDFLLEDEIYADLVSPYKDRPQCNQESETKLMSFVKQQYSNGYFEGARVLKMNECEYVIAVGTAALSKSRRSHSVRIAKLRAQNEMALLINQKEITSSQIIKAGDNFVNDDLSIYENFKEEISGKLFGFISGMQTLTVFPSTDNSTIVIILYQPL
jgi:hypothetical protein